MADANECSDKIIIKINNLQNPSDVLRNFYTPRTYKNMRENGVNSTCYNHGITSLDVKNEDDGIEQIKESIQPNTLVYLKTNNKLIAVYLVISNDIYSSHLESLKEYTVKFRPKRLRFVKKSSSKKKRSRSRSRSRSRKPRHQ